MQIKGNQIKSSPFIADGRVYTDGTVTLAELSVVIGNTQFTATGNSRRIAGDKYDQQTGELLAVHRALQQLENMVWQARQNIED